MHMHPSNFLNGRGPRALSISGPKSCRTECVGRDHVNLIAASRKLFGNVLDQHRGPVDRREVGLCNEN